MNHAGKQQATARCAPLPQRYARAHNGAREVWQLAEYFDVPDELVNKALTLYESDLITWKKKRIASQHNQ